MTRSAVIIGFCVLLGCVIGVANFVPSLWPDGQVTLPATVTAKAGWPCVIQAESSGKLKFWTDAPGSYFDEAGKRVVIASPKPSRFTVLAWTASWLAPSEAAVCVVTVGDGPGPEPGPSPNPEPPRPPPLSPLAQKLQAAFTRDVLTGASTAAHKTALASLYKHASDSVVAQTELKTVADLYAVLKQSAFTLLPATALPATRQAISEHLKTQLPTQAQKTLTPDDRVNARRVFSELAAALGEIK